MLQARTANGNPAKSAHQRAVLLVGHGSLRRGSGAAMIRIAARLRKAQLAPFVQAAFLNYSRPSVSEGIARCVAQGAREITVVPYFLVPGWFVKQTLPQLLNVCRAMHPGVTLRQTEPLGDHPALARLVVQRATEADYRCAFPQIAEPSVNRMTVHSDHWLPLYASHRTGLLIIAHGSPDADNNRPIYAVAERVRAMNRYTAVTVCFMDINRPTINEAIDDFAQNGIEHAIAMPYFLQLGNHVADDLPRLVQEGVVRHPHMSLLLAEHLGYDRLLMQPITDRVRGAPIAPNPPEFRPFLTT